MRTKQIVGLLCAVTIFATTFLTACAKKDEPVDVASTGSGSESGVKTIENFNPTGFPIVNEKITLELMGSKSGLHGDWKNMAFFKEMEKKTNIAFEFTLFPGEIYNEKKNLAFASGEYPDLFYNGIISGYDETIYGEGQNIIAPINDLIDGYAPTLKEFLSKPENADVKTALTHPNGKMYSFPQIMDRMHCLTNVSWFNKKWCDNLGLEVPTTTDELYEVLKAFKDKDANGNGDPNDEIPSVGGMMFSTLLNPFGLLTTGIEVNKEGKVIYAPIEPNYKHFLEYTSKLYKEGLIDQESFTQDNQQMTAKGNAMRYGLFTHAAAWLVCPSENDEEYIALKPLTSEYEKEPEMVLFNRATTGVGAITSTNKYPEATIRWFDYLYTDEGAILAENGPEGLFWDWTDDTKTAWKTNLPEGYASSEEYRGAVISPGAGAPIPTIVNSGFWSLAYSDKPPYNKTLNDRAESVREFCRQPFPQVFYTQEQMEEMGIISTDVGTYFGNMNAKFITGEESIEAKWDEYVKTIKDMGIDKWIAICQEAYDATLTNK